MRRLTLPVLTAAGAVFLLYSNLPVALAQRGVVPHAVSAVIPFLLALAVIHQLVVRRQSLVVDRTLVAMVLFLAIFLTAAFRAMGPDVAIQRIATYATEGLLIYLLVRNAVRTPRELNAVVTSVLVAATLLALLTGIQVVTGNYEQDFMGLAQRNLEHLEGDPGATVAQGERMGLEDRARGPVDDPNRYAQILLMAAPLAFIRWLTARRATASVVWLASLLILLAAILLTYSRGAFITLLVLFACCGPLRLLKPRRLVGALVICALLAPVVAPGYLARVASIGGVANLFGGNVQIEADGATRGRTTEMLAALAAYVEHPVIGLGPGQYLLHSVEYQSLPELNFRELATPRRAHNLYLEIAAETGTLGLLVFLAIPLLLLRDLQATRRGVLADDPERSRLAAGFMLVLVSYLGTGVFLHLSYERYYWFVIGLTSAAVAILSRAADHRPTDRLRRSGPERRLEEGAAC